MILNGDLVNFFRVVKHRAAELAERFDGECVAAERFRELRVAPAAADEIERALRFAYLVWWSYGAKGEHFAALRITAMAKSKTPVKRSLAAVSELLRAAAARLANVLIEQRDFADCIRRYDSRGTFFYCDPPYSAFARNGRYESLGGRAAELVALLARVKGRFLMSFDRHAGIVALARDAGLYVRDVAVNYTLASAGAAKRANEVLIANYPLRLAPARGG